MKLTLVSAAVMLALGSANALAYTCTTGDTCIDLVDGDTGTLSDKTIFNWVDQGSTGTGVIEPFLRVQANGTEQGYNYNTSALGGGSFDTKTGPWTHDLLMSDLVQVDINGVSYYEFLLDINETKASSARLISLNEVQIYTGSQLTSLTTDISTLGTLRYDMDGGADGDVTVEMDYSRNPGSGYGDVLMYIPTSYFAGASDSDYVYFYTMFGNANGSDAGFEDWALRPGACTPDNPYYDNGCVPPPPAAPEPGVLSLVGLGLLGLGYSLRKRKQA